MSQKELIAPFFLGPRRMRHGHGLLLLAVLLAANLSPSMAFIIPSPPYIKALARAWTLFLVGDFDDFQTIGDASSPAGEALAKEFYQEIRGRREAFDQDSVSFLSTQKFSQGEARRRNRQTFDHQHGFVGRKFVGSQSVRLQVNEPTPSAGLFSGRGVSVYSIPKNSPRQRVVEDDFGMVIGNERSLLIQLVATLTLLTFAIYIGVTGGISSNDFSALQESLDASIEGIEGALPVPTDTETSVWL